MFLHLKSLSWFGNHSWRPSWFGNYSQFRLSIPSPNNDSPSIAPTNPIRSLLLHEYWIPLQEQFNYIACPLLPWTRTASVDRRTPLIDRYVDYDQSNDRVCLNWNLPTLEHIFFQLPAHVSHHKSSRQTSRPSDVSSSQLTSCVIFLALLM